MAHNLLGSSKLCKSHCYTEKHLFILNILKLQLRAPLMLLQLDLTFYEALLITVHMKNKIFMLEANRRIRKNCVGKISKITKQLSCTVDMVKPRQSWLHVSFRIEPVVLRLHKSLWYQAFKYQDLIIFTLKKNSST